MKIYDFSSTFVYYQLENFYPRPNFLKIIKVTTPSLCSVSLSSSSTSSIWLWVTVTSPPSLSFGSSACLAKPDLWGAVSIPLSSGLWGSPTRLSLGGLLSREGLKSSLERSWLKVALSFWQKAYPKQWMYHISEHPSLSYTACNFSVQLNNTFKKSTLFMYNWS